MDSSKAGIYERIEACGITLAASPAGGNYETVVIYDGNNMCYTSGHNCKVNGVLPHVGKLGREVSLEDGREDAHQCIVNLLGSLHVALGDLNRIRKVVKMTGFVASDDTFSQQPKVLDAASDLLVEVFGEDIGRAARSAVGVSVLPNNQPVEIELLLELYN